MRCISKEDIEKHVGMKDAVGAVKQAFRMAETGSIETPLRTVIPAQNGSLLFMPAYSRELGLAVLKNVNVFPDNAAKGLITTPSKVLLIDAENGYVKAILDGTYLTQLRTGAATGAAFDLLARKKCETGALIGTGGQAAMQLEAMMTVRELREVRIFSRSREKREAFAETARAKYAARGTRIIVKESADECISNADLIVTVTTSGKPVFDGTLVKKGATVSCVGTYEPDRHEIDPALIARADRIYCDSKQAVLAESGDLLIPIRLGLITPDDIAGGLGEVIAGTLPGRENDGEIIVFETVGTAAQDLVTAAMAYEKVTKE